MNTNVRNIRHARTAADFSKIVVQLENMRDAIEEALKNGSDVDFRSISSEFANIEHELAQWKRAARHRP